MRKLIYIMICFVFIACAKKEKQDLEESVSLEEVTAEDVENDVENEVKAVGEAAEESDFFKNDNLLPKASEAFVQQQLQETINLMVLNNKKDINSALQTELTESIQQKVKTYTLNKQIEVLKLTQVKIEQQKGGNNLYEVQCSFEANGVPQAAYEGSAKAVMSVKSVNIDGEDYYDYKIYFETIKVKEKE